jgi:hypothetical protein
MQQYWKRQHAKQVKQANISHPASPIVQINAVLLRGTCTDCHGHVTQTHSVFVICENSQVQLRQSQPDSTKGGTYWFINNSPCATAGESVLAAARFKHCGTMMLPQTDKIRHHDMACSLAKKGPIAHAHP